MNKQLRECLLYGRSIRDQASVCMVVTLTIFAQLIVGLPLHLYIIILPIHHEAVDLEHQQTVSKIYKTSQTAAHNSAISAQ